MQQVFLRTCVMILAAVLAHAAPAVCTDAEQQPLKTRPIADFLEQQGQHLTKGIVPEFMSFGAYYNPQDGTHRAVSIDYAGLGARVIRKKTHGAVSLATKMDGLVYERPLPDGRAEVTIQLHTSKALTFVIKQPEADYDDLGQPIFGYRPQDLVEDYEADGHLDVRPSVGSSFFHIVLKNTAVGAALPDLVVFLGLGSPLPGQELVSLTMFADAHGTVRDDGNGQAGAVQVMQATDLDFSFPIEEIFVRALADGQDAPAITEDPDSGGQQQ